MRYLGIDFGSKRIGLAVSSEGIAFSRGVIPNDSDLFSALLSIVTKERIGSIVVGDTRSFGGRDNPVSKDADAFMERLKKESGMPVLPVFEAGSSIEASRYAPENSTHDDGAAAALILQRFLDMSGGVE